MLTHNHLQTCLPHVQQVSRRPGQPIQPRDDQHVAGLEGYRAWAAAREPTATPKV
jgi:hypothetical protein